MSEEDRPLALVTNDDGVGCRFLWELVAAVAPRFRVVVVAPSGEQSWIGRAFSRHRRVTAKLTRVPFAEVAWAVDGTPSDCVNLALGHLLGEEKPAVVLSGINIGYNVSMPLALSSGTIAGAIEGAAWGIPSAAFSLDLEQSAFDSLRRNGGTAEGAQALALRNAAVRAAVFAAGLLGERTEGRLMVHNYNFPCDCGPDTPVERTAPARLRLGSLYAPSDTPGTFEFRWNDGVDLSSDSATDLSALARGSISHTLLDYSALGLADAPH